MLNWSLFGICLLAVDRGFGNFNLIHCGVLYEAKVECPLE
jgi:hypothetical protein